MVVLAQSCQQVLGITDTNVVNDYDSSIVHEECGDRAVQGSEQCDDGNQVAGDGCSSSCRWEPAVITAGGQQSCVLANNGVAKCWGDNRYGELGLWDDRDQTVWDDRDRGVNEGELGAALSGVWLDSEHNARLIVTGHRHTCAALRDSEAAIRCWGGIEVNGTERWQGHLQFQQRVRVMAAGAFHTCALFEDGSLTCWGRNDCGQLGLGDTQDRDPLQNAATVAALSPVDFEATLKVGSFSTGGKHTCAVLQDYSLRCWGDNHTGQLGLGDSVNRGLVPQDLSQERSQVDLGLNRTAKLVVAGENHTCAILDNDALKCWGANDEGQLGLGDTRSRGAAPQEMGDSLPEVNLGGPHARGLALGRYHTCALLDDATVRCWGINDNGELGLGDTLARHYAFGGDAPSGQTVALGTIGRVRQLSAGTSHTCALLDDGTVKCWGWNASGQLGQGDTLSRGIAPEQMSDNLLPVDLKF